MSQVAEKFLGQLFTGESVKWWWEESSDSLTHNPLLILEQDSCQKFKEWLDPVTWLCLEFLTRRKGARRGSQGWENQTSPPRHWDPGSFLRMPSAGSDSYNQTNDVSPTHMSAWLHIASSSAAWNLGQSNLWYQCTNNAGHQSIHSFCFSPWVSLSYITHYLYRTEGNSWQLNKTTTDLSNSHGVLHFNVPLWAVTFY